MKNIFLILLLIINNISKSQSTYINELLANWANDIDLSQAHIGIAIHDVYEGNLIGGYNHNKFLTPASSLKTITTLITLKELGDSFRYVTKLAYSGRIDNGVLNGNIHIIGSGDPSLGSRRWKDKPNIGQVVSLFTYKIQRLGITKINGQIIADVSIFDRNITPPTWEWGDLGRGFGTSAHGINVSDNEFDIWYNSSNPPGNIANVINTVPEIPDLQIQNEVIITDANETEDVYIYGLPNSPIKRIMGTIPQEKNPSRIDAAIPDPALLFATLLKKELSAKAISVNDVAVHYFKQIDASQLTLIDSLSSHPMSELVRETNFFSLNVYCEAFLKTLGYKKGYRGSYSEGFKVVNNYFSKRGIDTQNYIMKDGSGLSARNLITPTLLSKALAVFAKENGFDYTTKFLPKAGEEGTVRRMLKDSKAKGKVWMKSGSLSKVMSYTGLIKCKNGRWISFSVIANSYIIKNFELRKKMEKLIEGIYNNL